MKVPSVPVSLAPSSRRGLFPFVLGGWAALAAVVTASGLLTVNRRFAVPAVLVCSVVSLIVAHRRDGPFRTWVRSLPLTALLALQSLRAPVGVAFFVMAAHGLAPPDFAAMAGWGDLAVGVIACALLALGDRASERPRALLAWNVLGLLDIAAVVLSAQVRFVVLDPQGLRGLLGTAFPLLPLFYVPLVIATHLLIFERLRADATTQPVTGGVGAPARG